MTLCEELQLMIDATSFGTVLDYFFDPESEISQVFVTCKDVPLAELGAVMVNGDMPRFLEMLKQGVRVVGPAACVKGTEGTNTFEAMNEDVQKNRGNYKRVPTHRAYHPDTNNYTALKNVAVRVLYLPPAYVVEIIGDYPFTLYEHKIPFPKQG